MTGMEESLEPFNRGQKEFELNIKKLRKVGEKSKGSRIIKRSLDHIIVLIEQWFDKAVNMEIQARRELNLLSSTMADVTTLIEEGTGKRIMDKLRAKLLTFKQVEQRLMAVRRLEPERGILFAEYVIIFGTLIILISSLVCSLWLASNIAKPIKLLKFASDDIGKGIYPGKIHIGTNDEVADLGNAFELMIDRIKANEEAIIAEKSAAESANQAKNKFLANMSHEIRTSLNAVLGYAQILLRDGSLGEEQLDAVKTINKSGNHLLTLINDILDISKIEAGKRELNLTVFDLSALSDEMRSVFSVQCNRKQITFNSSQHPEGKTIVNGDAGKLRQVLINLIGNAVKFTDSGSVEFRFQKQELDNLYLFEVMDTGKGIPLNAQESIFEPFKQNEEGWGKGGTGLGLFISRRLVNQMWGKLKLESEPGIGSRFYFSIPLETRKGMVISKTVQYQNAIRLKDNYKIKALVVDDIKENREVLAWFLKNIGVVVTTAENGKMAVDKIRTDDPDIVFMDIRMPVMDGVEAFHEIKKQYPDKDIKIICITASTLYQEEKKYLDMGFDSYIAKPFVADNVLGLLTKHLNVEYIYKEPEVKEPPQETPEDIDWSKVKNSEEIKTRILECADLYSVTQLEEACEQLESMENGGKELAHLLRKFLKEYDMDGIISTMNKVA